MTSCGNRSLRYSNSPNRAKLPPTKELKKFIASNMSRAESIDNFLHTHSENPKLVAIGKTAIASCILDAERSSSLMPHEPVRSNNLMFLSFGTAKETWLQRFCTMALTGVVLSEAHSAFDNVTLVTFNYDRCIELYLVQHIKEYLGIPEGAAQNIVDSINIIHVYGKVGRLPWQSGSGPKVSFGAKPEPQLLGELSREIRTFTERVEEDDTPRRIAAAICDAELIVFSGFSFGSSNWDFLQNDQPGAEKMVVAGVMGISVPNQGYIATRLENSLDPSRNVVVHTCEKGFLELLYDYSTFFE